MPSEARQSGHRIHHGPNKLPRFFYPIRIEIAIFNRIFIKFGTQTLYIYPINIYQFHIHTYIKIVCSSYCECNMQHIRLRIVILALWGDGNECTSLNKLVVDKRNDSRFPTLQPEETNEGYCFAKQGHIILSSSL